MILTLISGMAPGRLVEASVVQGWKAALSELALVYADCINAYLRWLPYR